MLRIALITMAVAALSAPAPGAQDDVILLHGLCRTSRSMSKMERALTDAGFRVHNVAYPSRTAAVATLADDTISKAVADCNQNGGQIHFVTHSLGGILVRSYLTRHTVPSLGRVVMLGPPNRGSEVVDKIGGWSMFEWINGPAGHELGTGPDSTPNKLGPATFPVGIIAGDRSINWINSALIPGTDDGKVSIERTKLDGMADHIVIHATHPMMMRHREAIRQTIHFLRNGAFERPTP